MDVDLEPGLLQRLRQPVEIFLIEERLPAVARPVEIGLQKRRRMGFDDAVDEDLGRRGLDAPSRRLLSLPDEAFDLADSLFRLDVEGNQDAWTVSSPARSRAR